MSSNTCCTTSTTDKLLSSILSTLKLIQASLTMGVDSETITLCDPTSGVPVIVRYRFGFVNGTQTSIVYDAWNVNGTAYTGDVTLLVLC